MEKDYTIFYGVYIILNIFLLTILLGAVSETKSYNTLDPTNNPEPFEPVVFHELHQRSIRVEKTFADYLEENNIELPKRPPPDEAKEDPKEEPNEEPNEEANKEPPEKVPKDPPNKPPKAPPVERPRAPIIYSGPTNQKRVAITFDDGPDPSTLYQMLDILDEYNVKSTFFLLGNRAKRSQSLVREIHNRGHQIASHSYSHPRFSNLTWDEAAWQITRTEEFIGDYMTHNYFRPPYGDYKRETLEVAHHLGYKIIYWNVDTRDWAAESPEQIVDAVKRDTKPGSIILFHEGKDLTLQALPEVLEWLIDEGYSFATVAELLGE